MEIPTIECEDCGWQGFVSSLVCSQEDYDSNKTSDGISFNLCPECGSKNIVDYED